MRGRPPFRPKERKARVRQILSIMDDMGIVRSGEKEGERLYFVREAVIDGEGRTRL